MRVIAGKYRHRILKWPDDAAHIRPTKDRIRESIFGALGNIEGKICLDLYSGSGAMGIEALSRGALKAIFVDINPIALNTTKDNLKSCLDIKEMGIRSDQYLVNLDNGKMLLPSAYYTLSPLEKDHMLKILKDVKVSDSYSFNISRCVKLKSHKLIGPKTHDCP